MFKPDVATWLRRFLLMLLPLLVVQTLFCVWYFHNERERQIRHELGDYQSGLARAEFVLANQLLLAVRDARMLALELASADRVEPNMVLRFLAARPVYRGLQWVNNHGSNRLLLERGSDGPVVVPAKAAAVDRETLAKLNTSDSVWLDTFGLELDRGEIRVPFQSSLTLAVPVSGAGALFLRVDTQQLFEQMRSISLHRQADFAVLNQEGGWIYGGEIVDRYAWLFSSSSGQKLSQRQPALWRALQIAPSGYFYGNRYVAFRSTDVLQVLAQSAQESLQLSARNPTFRIYLLSSVPVAQAQDWLAGIYWQVRIVWFLGALGLGLLAALLVNWYSRRRAQDVNVQRERQDLQEILDAAPVGVLVSDMHGARVYVNDSWCQLAGIPREVALGDGWRQALHPDDVSTVENMWHRLIDEHVKVDAEYRFRHEGGRIVWVRGCIQPVFDQGGWVRLFVGTVSDVSRLKEQESILQQNQLALEDAHDELDSILNSSPDAIVAIDPGFCLTAFNTAYAGLFQRLYGLIFERGACLLNLLEPMPKDRAHQMTLFGRALQGERFQVRQAYGPDEQLSRTFDLSLSPQYSHHGDLVGALMLLRDVTDAARIEEALKRNEELFRAATESSLDAIFILEAIKDKAWKIIDFRVLEANQNALDLLGARREDAIGEMMCELLPATRTVGLFDKYCRVFESNVPLLEERAISDPNIHASWLHYQAVSISNGIVLTVRDISERKETERRIFENEARMAAILANVQDGVVTLDWLGLIRSANPACSHLFGRPYTDLLGQSLAILFPQLSSSLGSSDLVKICRERLGLEIGIACEVQASHRDGSAVPLEVTLKLVSFADETFYTVTLHDLTERKESECLLQNNIQELEALQSSLNETNNRLLQANKELSRLAHVDGLTGLANRRFFDEHYAQEWSRSHREQLSLSVAMLDVDFFKRYNDGYGHQAGDECLKKVASVLAEHLHRPGDFVARYGGEEFIIVMPNTTSEGAERVVAGILQGMRALRIPHAFSNVAEHVTLSAGIASALPVGGMTPEFLVYSADQALYQAKLAGRDRYQIV